jgi:hypothetical protein
VPACVWAASAWRSAIQALHPANIKASPKTVWRQQCPLGAGRSRGYQTRSTRCYGAYSSQSSSYVRLSQSPVPATAQPGTAATGRHSHGRNGRRFHESNTSAEVGCRTSTDLSGSLGGSLNQTLSCLPQTAMAAFDKPAIAFLVRGGWESNPRLSVQNRSFCH